ncbi:MAG: HAMP domain-containing protein [Chloroflexi bacterium]|nr:HAMP domain-containing protein [Chloroflexota bacterium]
MTRFHSLQWRIVLAYTALIFISMGMVSLYLVDFVRGTYLSNLEDQLEKEAGLVAETIAGYFRDPLDQDDLPVITERLGALTGARVTIITRNGMVLADTWQDPSSTGDQAGRPEFQDAIRTGLGRSTRVSGVVGQELLYTAVPIRVDGAAVGVARIGVPTSQVQANVNRIMATIALSALAVAFLSLGLGYYLARRTSRSIRAVTEAARRLAGGDLEQRVEALTADETQELAAAFNRMAAALRDEVHGLSAERNKLSAVLDTMADGVVVIRAEGRIELVNRAAQELLQLAGQDAVGGRFMETVRDHELQRLVSRSFETARQHHDEVELLHTRRFLSVVATPLSGDGSPGVLLTLHDLTGIRQMDTTRREFVSNVSHELRTPLASLKAMVETLESGALDEPQAARDFVRRIHGEIERLGGMAGDLLELSRLESGQVSLHTALVDLGLLVLEVQGQFQPRAEAKGIVLEVSLPGGLPRVLGEPDKLRQVLINLLDNALKFTAQGGRIVVAASEEGRCVEVSVRDTGIGISQEHLPHVFERFYKADRSRRDGGTGLGLSIVKHIVQAHGGEVRVVSREGEGSTFSFTVPKAPSGP